jgi:replicative superfamily II helicase
LLWPLSSQASMRKPLTLFAAVQVIAAPTGSGKTGVMELAMLRLYSKLLDAGGNWPANRRGGLSKAVYLAPMRALVQEKLRDFQERFGRVLGLKCCEVTGDIEPDPQELEAADIICTTPEKFGGYLHSWLALLPCSVTLWLTGNIELLLQTP